MTTKIINIGNSRGIRIPHIIIKQCEFENDIIMEVKDNKLILSNNKPKRCGWAKAFKEMHKNKDDKLLIPDNIQNKWDNEEWIW